MSALEAETDPAAALALIVPLLFTRATGRVLVMPGKAMAGVLAWLRGRLPEGELDEVEAFHAMVRKGHIESVGWTSCFVI